MTAGYAEFRIVEPAEPAVSELLDFHVRAARTAEYGKFAFALDHSQLAQPGITLFGAFAAGSLMAIGALKELGSGEVEIKSMRAAPEARGKGYGRLMLDHLIAEARSRRAVMVRLETGTTPEYDPANRLYASAGFKPTGPFADYRESDYNRFYALAL